MKKSFLILSIALFSFTIYSQSKTDSIRINKLENNIRTLEKDLNTTEKWAWDSKINAEKINKEVEENSINFFTKYFKLWMLLGTVLGVLGVWIFSKKIIDERIKKRLELKTDDYFDYLNRVIESEQWAIDIRKKYKVLILNKKGTDLNRSLEQVLSLKIGKGGFTKSQINIDLFSEVNDNNITNNDVFIVDNADTPDNSWNYDDNFKDDLLTFTKKLNEKKKGIFYFSNKQGVFFPTHGKIYDSIQDKILISYANAHAQIYPNIMNLLKIMNLLNVNGEK